MSLVVVRQEANHGRERQAERKRGENRVGKESRDDHSLCGRGVPQHHALRARNDSSGDSSGGDARRGYPRVSGVSEGGLAPPPWLCSGGLLPGVRLMAARLRAQCHGNQHFQKHDRRCRMARPLCKVRRREAGQQICECPSYPFPHRLGSGHCGQPEVATFRRKWRTAS